MDGKVAGSKQTKKTDGFWNIKSGDFAGECLVQQTSPEESLGKQNQSGESEIKRTYNWHFTSFITRECSNRKARWITFVSDVRRELPLEGYIYHGDTFCEIDLQKSSSN